MRIQDERQLKEISKRHQAQSGAGGGMSDWAVQQIQAQLKASEEPAFGAKGEKSKPHKPVAGESPGEASLRLALRAAFGDWHQGGEVVQELIPFQDRGFRSDFALPRYRIYVEVLGWSVHGQHKADHLMDCERGLFFSSRNWLPFYASHGTATQRPGNVVDALTAAISVRTACPRSQIQLLKKPHKHGVWYQLIECVDN